MRIGRRRVVAAGNSSQSGTGWGSGNVGEVTPPPVGGFTFTETFDSGDLSGGALNSTTPGQFAWATGSGVVTTDDKFSGTHGFRMRYPAVETGVALGRNQERRFWLGTGLGEFWFSFMWKVPTNYVHRDEVGPDNNKLFSFFRDSVGDTSLTFVGEFERVSNTRSTFRPMSTGSNFSTVGTVPGTFHLATGNRFIDPAGPVVPGQWHQLRFHFKPSSAVNVLDAAWEMWIDGVKFFTASGGPDGLDIWNKSTRTDDIVEVRRGYIAGYTNSGYSEETDFYFDDVQFTNVNPGW